MNDEPKPMTIDELAAGELPEASKHVVDAPPPQQPQPEAKPQAAPVEEIKDNSGRKFNPEKHLAGPDGKPLLTDKGYFRVIPKGQSGIVQGIKEKWNRWTHREDPKPEPSKESNPEPTPAAAAVRPGSLFVNPFKRNPPPEESAESKRKADAEAAAAQTVAMEEMIAVMVFSEEWVLLDAEKQNLIRAWAKAYEEKGVVEMPWWLELVAAHGIIITGRINKPKTQTTLEKARGWIAHKFVDFRMRRKSRKVEVVEVKEDGEA